MDAVEQFWNVARVKGRVTRLEIFVGQAPRDSIPPPAWAFGDDPATADDFVTELLAGRRTATTSPLADYGSDPTPDVGDLSIVLDGGGRPRALIRTTGVSVDETAGEAVVEETFELVYPRPPKHSRDRTPSKV